ncbi:MAG: response regulator [Verrucomicrobiota bacterium]|nr:response regulator [Verrucomicrobiota bacterium]
MGKKILVIDDSLTLRKFIRKTLIQSLPDPDIETSNDGATGILAVNDFSPDLILLDYILPDFKGDEICLRLLQNPLTASIPVVLMSSSGDEIREIRRKCPNIVGTLTKPFTPELLIATITQVFQSKNDLPSKPSSTSTGPKLLSTSQIALKADSHICTMGKIFRLIEEQSLTGVLRINYGKELVELFCHQGQFELATTRNTELYLHDTSYVFNPTNEKEINACIKGQSDSGCPCFSLMAERNLIPRQMVNPLIDSHGQRLMANACLAPYLMYEFELLNNLPEYVPLTLRKVDSADNFLLKFTRHHDPLIHLLPERPDTNGIPSLTPMGFLRVPYLEMSREETEFIRRVDGSTTLSTLATKSGFPLETIEFVLYRFSLLDYLNFWPSRFLNG